MMVYLDDKWAISVDSYGNHQPHNYREVLVRDKITKQYSPSGNKEWVAENSYHPSFASAIRGYIIPKMMLDGFDTLTMKEYIAEFERVTSDLVSKLDKALGVNK